MTRENLEHIIRAIGDMINVQDITIFGSQSILAQHPNLENIINSKKVHLSPKKHDIDMLKRSMEADVFVKDNNQANIVESNMGDMSTFHNTHGYFIDTVDETTSKLPRDWQNRLIQISNKNTNNINGWCLEKHDLILSKLYANREKDLKFFNAMISLSLLKKKTLIRGLNTMQIKESEKTRIKQTILKAFDK